MFAWIDIETTGLDYSKFSQPGPSRLLEIGVVVTDDDLNELGSIRVVVHHPEIDRHAYDPFVTSMHTANGLWDLVADPETSVPIWKASRMVTDFLDDFFVPTDVMKDRPPMAGSSVQFDRQWLEVHCPDIFRRFSYRNADISGIREFARRWTTYVVEPTAPVGAHRSIEDLRDTIELARVYKEMIFDVAEGAGPQGPAPRSAG